MVPEAVRLPNPSGEVLLLKAVSFSLTSIVSLIRLNNKHSYSIDSQIITFLCNRSRKSGVSGKVVPGRMHLKARPGLTIAFVLLVLSQSLYRTLGRADIDSIPERSRSI